MLEDIKETIKKNYTLAINTGCGCGPECCSNEESASFLIENYQNLPGYQKIADYGLGCGLPTEMAEIKSENNVLDLGCGAGNDAFIARNQVGEKGKVIGVDFTKAMIEKAIENKNRLGFENMEFLLGDIEDLPILNDSIDVVISNCVLNLVPNKRKAYSEVFRVLKSGGHFSISDVVLNADLPNEIREAAELYAGCISGAIDRIDYLNIISETGFIELEIKKEHEIILPDSLLLKYVSPDFLSDFKLNNSALSSITIHACKP